jgi:hypothetical protein
LPTLTSAPFELNPPPRGCPAGIREKAVFIRASPDERTRATNCYLVKKDKEYVVGRVIEQSTEHGEKIFRFSPVTTTANLSSADVARGDIIAALDRDASV